MSAPQLRQTVRPEWVDYNGHLSEAYYVLVFGFATDALMERIGLDKQYRDATGASLYTVEAHVRYLHEVKADATMLITTRIIGGGTKKLRICHEMTVNDELVATEEILALHVDQHAGRATAFPSEVAQLVAELHEQPPEYAGRSIG